MHLLARQCNAVQWQRIQASGIAPTEPFCAAQLWACQSGAEQHDWHCAPLQFCAAASNEHAVRLHIVTSLIAAIRTLKHDGVRQQHMLCLWVQ